MSDGAWVREIGEGSSRQRHAPPAMSGRSIFPSNDQRSSESRRWHYGRGTTGGRLAPCDHNLHRTETAQDSRPRATVGHDVPGLIALLVRQPERMPQFVSERPTTAALCRQLISKPAFGQNGPEKLRSEDSTRDWTEVANEKD